MLDIFISNIAGPIFFGLVAINSDFYNDFNIATVGLYMVIAVAGKIIGSYVGGIATKSSHKEALAMAICMNSRGAMEIILANVALNANIINNQAFVALTLMALITSVMPGPLLRLILGRRNRRSFTQFTNAFLRLKSTDTLSALHEMCIGIKQTRFAAYLNYEGSHFDISNALTNELLLCHIISDDIKTAVIAIGVANEGITCEHVDGGKVRFIVACILPKKALFDSHLLNEIKELFHREAFINELTVCKNLTAFKAIVNIENFHKSLENPRVTELQLEPSDPRAIVLPSYTNNEEESVISESASDLGVRDRSISVAEVFDSVDEKSEKSDDCGMIRTPSSTSRRSLKLEKYDDDLGMLEMAKALSGSCIGSPSKDKRDVDGVRNSAPSSPPLQPSMVSIELHSVSVNDTTYYT